MNKERLQQLLEELRQMPGELDVVRQAEAQAKLARDQAREDYDLAVVNALMMSNGQVDGKNAEERKLKQDHYLNSHPDVRAKKARLATSEANLLEAQLVVRKEEDVFTALRAEARVLASYLEYLAGEPRRK